MRSLPVPDPGSPDSRSPVRYLCWLVRANAAPLTAGSLLCIVWLGTQALLPSIVGHAIDAGITARNGTRLLEWTAVLVAAGGVQSAAGVMMHRRDVFTWLSSAYLTVQVTSRRAARLGATLPRRMSSGEVVAVGNSDVANFGNLLTHLMLGVGSLFSTVLVIAVLLASYSPLGVVVVVGVPLIAAAIGPALRPLHRRQQHQRDLVGELATRAGDIVGGLRVLRGIGGERMFSERYRDESQAVRRSGVRVAQVDALLAAAQTLLPGLLAVAVVWFGARQAVAGHITVGQLVTFYGYTAFLLIPIQMLTQLAQKLVRGLVSARRVTRILELEPDVQEPDEPAAPPPPGRELHDPVSGLTVRPGELVAVVSGDPAVPAELADRLGRYRDGGAELGGVELSRLPVDEVRRRILVADGEARLFAGTLRGELDPSGAAGPEGIAAAVRTAAAEDIVEALPEGLDAPVAERGRDFSGGQQQRLRLVRALAADPEVLVLIEPTSAVDAHTEAAVAARLGAHRAGRSTVVVTSSPLLLDRVDRVAFLDGDGRVAASGSHGELVRSCPEYAAVVVRAG